MNSLSSLLGSQSAASSARLFLVYPLDMPRRSPMKQPAIRPNRQAGESPVIRDTLHLGLLATSIGGNQ